MSVAFYWFLFQDEPGAQVDPAVGLEHDWLNGVPGSTSSAAVHHPAGPKKKRHRIARHEKDKEQHVGDKLWGPLVSSRINSTLRSISYFLSLWCQVVNSSVCCFKC